MSKIQTEYRDHTISYNESSDAWECDAFASRQGSPTLTHAKERIDKLLEPKPDKPKFTPVEVWASQFKFNTGWVKIKLTSQTEDGYWASLKGEREKLGKHNLYRLKAATTENDATIAKINGLNNRIEVLRGEISDLEKKLTPFTP